MAKQPYGIPVLATLLIVTLVLSGCIPAAVINTMDMPGLQSGSPLKSIESRTFVINEFEDIRIKINDDKRLMRPEARTWRLDQDPATLVSKAVRNELERNGHKTVDYSPDAKSDYVIDGTVFKFSSIVNAGTWSGTVTSTIGLKLTVSRVPNSRGVFVKTYQGVYASKEGSTPTKPMTISIREALLMMVKDISTDQELIEFLQQDNKWSQVKTSFEKKGSFSEIKPQDLRDTSNLNEGFETESSEGFYIGHRDRGDGGQLFVSRDTTTGANNTKCSLRMDYKVGTKHSSHLANYRKSDWLLYSGIEFYAKSDPSDVIVHFVLVDENRKDDKKHDIWYARRQIDNSWKKYRIDFKELKWDRFYPDGDGILSLDLIKEFNFNVNKSANKPGISGRLWIDEIKLY